jgi:lysozyme family protein
MQLNFNPSLSFTLVQEGGWSANPDDPGGDTMEGITLAVYREWSNDPSLTGDDLRNITDADVATIYQQNYWNIVQGDKLKNGVDLSVFDMQVNSGSHSAKILQAIVGTTVDGAIGPKTIAATNAIMPVRLINALALNQAAFYRSLSNFPIFGHGWINRVNARHAAALAMAAGTHPNVQQSLPMAGKVLDSPADDFYALIKRL